MVRPGLDGAGTRRALEMLERSLAQLPENEWNAHSLQSHARGLIEAAALPRRPVEEALSVALTGYADIAALYSSLASLGRRVAARRLRVAVLELSVVS